MAEEETPSVGEGAEKLAGSSLKAAGKTNPATSGLSSVTDLVTDPKKRKWTLWGILGCCGCCALPFIIGLVLGIATVSYYCDIYVKVWDGIKIFDRYSVIESTIDLANNKYVQAAYYASPENVRSTTPLSTFIEVAQYKSILDEVCTVSGINIGSYGSYGGTVICPDGTISVLARQPDMIARLNENLDDYKKVSQETGVPWELLAAIHYRETNFSTNVGGDGPMQFIASTWRGYARDGNGDGVKDRTNFDDSLLGAAAYLDALVGGKFSNGTYSDEDIKLASLYYNRGTASSYGKNYDTHPYTMNNIDAAHHNMVWPSNDGYIRGKDSRDGAYTVYALLKNATFNADNKVSALGDCTTQTLSGDQQVPFATQNPLDLSNTNQNYGQPTHIVLHYTADNLSGNSIHNYFQGTLNDGNSSNNTYVQFWIGKNGEIMQFTPANKLVAGAAGFNSTGNGGVSISIENQGLNGIDPVSTFNSNSAQVDANVKLIKYLMETYNIPKENIVPHSAVTPGKIDPGEEFMQLALNRI